MNFFYWELSPPKVLRFSTKHLTHLNIFILFFLQEDRILITIADLIQNQLRVFTKKTNLLHRRRSPSERFATRKGNSSRRRRRRRRWRWRRSPRMSQGRSWRPARAAPSRPVPRQTAHAPTRPRAPGPHGHQTSRSALCVMRYLHDLNNRFTQTKWSDMNLEV